MLVVKSDKRKDQLVQQADPRPSKLEILPDGLHIVWPDGFETLMPHRYVRGNCSCAECVDEISHVRRTGVDDVKTDVEIVEYMDVGRYAVGLLFSDLHDSGIFPFKRLRALADGHDPDAQS
jgi:ATP-binding protein involved in chromosome partitioning